ncbi:MAG TPA: response regulator [Catalimonadaceae bacterium]|nr:response regulator [Catalimonadaceae bacterium]
MQPIHSLCVIDDDVIYQFAVKLNIKQLELAKNVLTFSNGELAKIFFEENLKNNEALPEVILLDINMPVMDGWDFLDWFKSAKTQISKKITIFMVSSSIDWRDIEKAKSYDEVSDYLSKPLTDGNFFEIVERLNKS